MLHLGTSGFSYEDWKEHYYPKGLPRRAWLSFYAQEFSACELNFTFYTIPAPATLEALADRVPEGFLFTVKASKEITHQRAGNAAAFPAFLRSVEALRARGKLGCILAQFPYSFHPIKENREYVARLRERLGGLPLAVEFRNGRWLESQTYAMLREKGIALCLVDGPRLPGLPEPARVVTAPIAYVRFHGRNAQTWWEHQEAWERYNYSYSREELAEWVPIIGELERRAEATFIFANNHWRAQAVMAMRELRELLAVGIEEKV